MELGGPMMQFALVVTAIMSWGIADLNFKENPKTNADKFFYSMLIFCGGWIIGSVLWYILWLLFIQVNPLF